MINISEITQFIERFLIPVANRGKIKPGVVNRYDIASMEAKIDGIRALVYWDPDVNRPVIMSREGKECYNVKHLVNPLLPLLRLGYLFDAELYVKDWNTTMHLARTASDLSHEEDQLHLFVFDMLTKEEVEAGGSDIPYPRRRMRLIQVLKRFRNPYIHITERIKIKNPDDIEKAFKRFLAKGYEGGVAKASSGKYMIGGSTEWWKVKTVHTEDYPVVGFKEGEGQFKGSLGALQVNLGRGQTAYVSGFDTNTRRELWKMCLDGSIIGKFIEVAFQQASKNSVRHPHFVRLRLDRMSAKV